MKYFWSAVLAAPLVLGLALWAQTAPSASATAPVHNKFADTPPSPSAGSTLPEDQTRIILDVTRVNVLFTVTDKKGRFITDLGKDDFQVIENKKPQVIQQFTAESDLPLRLAVL